MDSPRPLLWSDNDQDEQPCESHTAFTCRTHIHTHYKNTASTAILYVCGACSQRLKSPRHTYTYKHTHTHAQQVVKSWPNELLCSTVGKPCSAGSRSGHMPYFLHILLFLPQVVNLSYDTVTFFYIPSTLPPHQQATAFVGSSFSFLCFKWYSCFAHLILISSPFLPTSSFSLTGQYCCMSLHYKVKVGQNLSMGHTLWWCKKEKKRRLQWWALKHECFCALDCLRADI